MKARFEGRVAIVTGAAKGMGLATAVEMARGGAVVVLADIDAQALQAVAVELQRVGSVTTVACDIQDRKQVDALVQGTRKGLGRVDILVNNAGLLLPGTIEETTDDIIGRTLATNVKGILYAIREVCGGANNGGHDRKPDQRRVVSAGQRVAASTPGRHGGTPTG